MQKLLPKISKHQEGNKLKFSNIIQSKHKYSNLDNINIDQNYNLIYKNKNNYNRYIRRKKRRQNPSKTI